jgi:hypothetical protein
LRERPERFCETRSMARIAVYRNPVAMVFNSLEPQLQAILAEETLLEHHLPFDIILNLKNVEYGALIVPGIECLSTDEVARLMAYAQGGGRLILVGDAGRYDDWRREWAKPPFDDGGKMHKPTPCGKGWIVKIPALQLPARAPAPHQRAVWDEHYKVIDARFWILPRNARTLLDALGDVTVGGVTPIQVLAPRTTIVEPRRAKDGATVYIHIIRYADKRRNEKLTIRMQEAKPVRTVSFISPGEKERPLLYRQNKGAISFSVVPRGPYALVAVTT